MEPQSSVLLYSKYSSASKKLMDFIRSSGVDFTSLMSLQPVCIDNEEIRKRILKNEQIDITSVPCVLIIYPDGGIEKYDGAHVFTWSEEIIRQYAPPPPPRPQPPQHPQPIQETEEQRWQKQKVMEQRQAEQIAKQKEMEKERLKEQNRKLFEQQQKKQTGEVDEEEPRRKAKKPKTTSIDDLPSDEEDDTVADRYRKRKPVGRIRKDEGNYDEDDEELFQGSPPNMRRAKKSAVKTATNAAQQKSLDIMSKAKELAKGRQENPHPPGHPANREVV